jgi:hypothetical protein
MNLQDNILALSTELRALYLTATPPSDSQIEKILDALDKLSIAALEKTLDEDSADFQTAITTLTNATQAATTAVQDLSKTADAIAGAVQVVKVLDKLLGYASSLVL